jgi:hypothetical protein
MLAKIGRDKKTGDSNEPPVRSTRTKRQMTPNTITPPKARHAVTTLSVPASVPRTSRFAALNAVTRKEEEAFRHLVESVEREPGSAFCAARLIRATQWRPCWMHHRRIAAMISS